MLELCLVLFCQPLRDLGACAASLCEKTVEQCDRGIERVRERESERERELERERESERVKERERESQSYIYI